VGHEQLLPGGELEPAEADLRYHAGDGRRFVSGALHGDHLRLDPNATAETTLIRALGTCALLLLHLILCIGPLCRLNPRFLPLLYNRRHLGVTMFILRWLTRRSRRSSFMPWAT
jgi:hypothetical protein